MKSAYRIITHPLQTEKGLRHASQNKYFFLVDKQANKVEIKRAIEEIYKVKVKKVNSAILPGKLKRVRVQIGRTPDWKKAIVTLRQGEKIELT